MKGYFDYVVPPLEGFGWQDGISGTDYTHKEDFIWISVIRLPDFVTKADFDWAVEETAKKMKQDFSKVEFLSHDEGLCVQCMQAPMMMSLLLFRSCMNIWKRRAMIWISRISVCIMKYI